MGFDVKHMARRVRELRALYEVNHPGCAVPIGDTLSRLLENDEEWLRGRKRGAGVATRPLKEPGASTIVKMAEVLETTPNDLLGFGENGLSEAAVVRLSELLREVVEILEKEKPSTTRRG